jgi:hypothetical protein
VAFATNQLAGAVRRVPKQYKNKRVSSSLKKKMKKKNMKKKKKKVRERRR